jgi:hypothetical protein
MKEPDNLLLSDWGILRIEWPRETTCTGMQNEVEIMDGLGKPATSDLGDHKHYIMTDYKRHSHSQGNLPLKWT